ncbi:response regulator transcription factor [Knoellia sp. p5-6-4]|uniref:response regulator transcription factor n=2 Tax=unclassified Knoellia TaxID=2618719 RepID=UPI0023DBB2C1|nr:response regulator transcription factor [Knoellia sp. p5-6-4]MDF2146817.1 response regulator transcription factor [Knoellia sp. p5-6-4]
MWVVAATSRSADPTPSSERSGTALRNGLRALVVEDDVHMASLVGTYLEREGFEVALSHDGLDAVQQAREVDPDIVVLDLGLPRLDGIEVCRRLRTFSDAYVIMLTARADEVDTLVGLSVGADDYMTKPFSPRELVARLRAMLRRPRPLGGGGPETADLRRFGALAIDPVGRDVWLGQEPVSLTRTEFDVLAALSERPRMAFSRRQLVDAVWGETWVGDEHLVDVHIGHLRRKLGDDATEPRFIRTVRGIGYRMGTGE